MSYSIYDRYEEEYPEDDRQCEKCIHYCAYDDPASGCKKGCSAWECQFEEKESMTISQALKIAENFEIDYKGMTEAEVEEMDEAVDKVFEYAKKYVKERTGEWILWTDGATGRPTGAATCSRCGSYNKIPHIYCSHCGSQNKGV
jgi:hypothetical protein